LPLPAVDLWDVLSGLAVWGWKIQ